MIHSHWGRHPIYTPVDGFHQQRNSWPCCKICCSTVTFMSLSTLNLQHFSPFLRRLNTWKWYGQRSGCMGDRATCTTAYSTDCSQHCAPQGQTSRNTIYPLWAWWKTFDGNVKGLQTPNHWSDVDSGWRKRADATIVQWFRQHPSESSAREDTSGDVSMECLHQCLWVPVLMTFTWSRMQMVFTFK
jgi:hypothetical protein